MCVCFVIVTSLRVVTDGNKETTYLLSSFLKKLMLHLISPSGIFTNVRLGTSRTLRLSSFFFFFRRPISCIL